MGFGRGSCVFDAGGARLESVDCGYSGTGLSGKAALALRIWELRVDLRSGIRVVVDFGCPFSQRLTYLETTYEARHDLRCLPSFWGKGPREATGIAQSRRDPMS